MGQQVYMATVQIIIDPSENISSQGEAEDFFTALLTDNNAVLDWSYLKVGGQYMYPVEVLVDDNYQEGGAF